MVTKSQSTELSKAKKLMWEAKFKEALTIIKNFEKKVGISEDDRLTALILKGRIHINAQNYQEAVNVGEIAYDISEKLGSVSGKIGSLFVKFFTAFLGNYDEGLDIALEAERLIDQLEKNSSSDLTRERAENLFEKGWAYTFTGDYDKALESALQSLSIEEKLGRATNLALIHTLIGTILYSGIGKPVKALDYAMKSLEIQKELNNSEGIAGSLYLIGSIHFTKGDFDQAILSYKQALEIDNTSNLTNYAINYRLGRIYGLKGELDLALEFYEKAFTYSKAMDHKHANIAANWVNIGSVYRMKGNYDKAVEVLKQSLELKIEDIYYFRLSLFWLVLINLDRNLRNEAEYNLSLLKEQSDKIQSKLFTQTYQLANSLVMKASGRTRDRYEAENLLKQIVEGEILEPEIYILSLVSLCEFLIEELENSNDLQVIDEINPVIARLMEIAEKQHSYSVLAETNLLQGRLALIMLNLNDARSFLTTAQKIADEHGLQLLAQKISHEHDELLEELETWQSLKKKKASVSKRLKLASVDGVMNRMLGKRAVEPPAMIEEEPIMLLIMDTSGNTFFTHIFAMDWDYDDLFSSFMSAFNTFSSEIFSKSIDRIKIDENLILISPIEPFLICYVIKGQSYSALKKLNSFAETIKNKPEIWDSLQKSIKTSEMLDLDNPPSLGVAVSEIFSS
ncbi:MAG: tetratricopeptide repeat protein [Promethearchaeota archaeon]|jgi:tetratricopeptide (TPR) repeat protein